MAGAWTRKKVGTAFLFLQTFKLATSNLVYILGLGLAYQKQRLGQICGVWARQVAQKLGHPTYFCTR